VTRQHVGERDRIGERGTGDLEGLEGEGIVGGPREDLGPHGVVVGLGVIGLGVVGLAVVGLAAVVARIAGGWFMVDAGRQRPRRCGTGTGRDQKE